MIIHRYVGPEFPLLAIPAFSEWELLDLEVKNFDYLRGYNHSSEGATLF
jgi:hypothetical protein